MLIAIADLRGCLSNEEARLTNVKTYTDLLYDEQDGLATITINRPEKHNAFRGLTCDELIDAFNSAGWNRAIGVIVLILGKRPNGQLRVRS